MCVCLESVCLESVCLESVSPLKLDVFPSPTQDPRKKDPTRERGVCMCADGNKTP